MACSTGVDRAAIGDGKEEAVVLWPGICSTIVSFRYHFILGVSRFLTVCETSPLPLASSPSLPLFPSAATSEVPHCSAFYSSSSSSSSFWPLPPFRVSCGALLDNSVLSLRIDFRCKVGSRKIRCSALLTKYVENSHRN